MSEPKGVPVENKEPKTPEQLKEERLKRYQENPDSFVEYSEVIIAVLRKDKGMQPIFGKTNLYEITQAVSELQFRLFKMRLDMELQLAELKEQNKIVKPKHGILDFARRK